LVLKGVLEIDETAGRDREVFNGRLSARNLKGGGGPCGRGSYVILNCGVLDSADRS